MPRSSAASASSFFFLEDSAFCAIAEVLLEILAMSAVVPSSSSPSSALTKTAPGCLAAHALHQCRRSATVSPRSSGIPAPSSARARRESLAPVSAAGGEARRQYVGRRALARTVVRRLLPRVAGARLRAVLAQLLRALRLVQLRRHRAVVVLRERVALVLAHAALDGLRRLGGRGLAARLVHGHGLGPEVIVRHRGRALPGLFRPFAEPGAAGP